MSDKLDADYWNGRYVNDDAVWDLGTVSPPLKAYIDQLEKKDIKILIPGCGNSYEAEYLLEKGFMDITLIDIADEPVKKLQQQFTGENRVKILQQDFFTAEGNYDLILEQTFLSALPPSVREEYAKKMHALLSPGGKLTGVIFSSGFEKDGPPWGGTMPVYKKLFEPYFHLKIFEPCYNSIAQRMGNELFICLIRR